MSWAGGHHFPTDRMGGGSEVCSEMAIRIYHEAEGQQASTETTGRRLKDWRVMLSSRSRVRSQPPAVFR